MLNVKAETRLESSAEGLCSPFVASGFGPDAKLDVAITLIGSLNLQMDTQTLGKLLQKL
jgi:hypothetical protein